MLKLKSNEQDAGSLYDMKDGNIGIIVSAEVDDYIGSIVQRYSDDLITLGGKVEKSWEDIFDDMNESTPSTIRVRVLKAGEELVVV